MVNDIYQTLELWAKLSPSSCQPQNVVNDRLPNKESNSEPEQDVEMAGGDAGTLGSVVKEA
jgi:hypothetical protein